MLDVEDLVDQGFSAGNIATAAEQALKGLIGCTTPEANMLRQALVAVRDECERLS